MLPAQSASPADRSHAGLGLPRLVGKSGVAAPVPASKFAVDDLSPGASPESVKSRKAGRDVLTVRAGTEWSRPLRGSSREPQFISFLVCASQSTIVEIDGARLGITLSPADASLQVMFDEPGSGGLQWRSLGLHVPIEAYAGEELVSLPLMTVHLDPVAGVWSLYIGLRMVADHLPLISGPGMQRKFTLKGGNAGVWLGELVMADENPLYEDANGNGIDDAFEKQKRGNVLAPNANLADRKSLAQEWQASQRTTLPPALFVRRPIPDNMTSPFPRL